MAQLYSEAEWRARMAAEAAGPPPPPPDRMWMRETAIGCGPDKPARKRQSRRKSLAEAIASSLIGFGISVAVQAYIFPFFGVHVALSTNIALVLIFTVVSIVRSYCVRRFFEWIG